MTYSKYMYVTLNIISYIKEFVHGDLGRTDPSLRTILDVPIDIVELDVMVKNFSAYISPICLYVCVYAYMHTCVVGACVFALNYPN